MSSSPTRYFAEIAHFHAGAALNTLVPNTESDENVAQAIKALNDVGRTQRFVLGTHVQNGNEVQLTSEWDGNQDDADFTTTHKVGPLVASLHNVYGESDGIYHVAMNRPLFELNGAATASVVEYAQSWFPASRVTPEFEKDIEADFLRFNEICEREAKGHLGWAVGWVLEEQEHEDIDGKAKCFLVLRGWNSMSDFERLTKSAAFPEAISILLGWKAPFKMWHIERRN